MEVDLDSPTKEKRESVVGASCDFVAQEEEKCGDLSYQDLTALGADGMMHFPEPSLQSLKFHA